MGIQRLEKVFTLCLACGLMLGCNSGSAGLNSNGVTKLDPDKTPRPARCKISNSSKKIELVGEQVDEPWRLYLAVRNSSELKAFGKSNEHKIAPRYWMWFYETNAPVDQYLYVLAVYGDGSNLVLGLSGDGMDYQIPASLSASLETYFRKIKSEQEANSKEEKPSP